MVQRFTHVMIAEARLGSLADSGKRSGQHCRRALDHGGRNGVLGRINLIFQIIQHHHRHVWFYVFISAFP